MSATSIIIRTDELLDEKTQDTYICMGSKVLMFKDYMVGQMPDIEKFKKIKRINSILQYDECLFGCFEQIKQKLNKLTNC